MDDARTKNKAIDAILKKIAKEHQSTERDPHLAGVTTTGCLRLDVALQTTGYPIGGLPLGRIIEVFGDPGSGKTSVTLSWLALYKKNHPKDERPILICDLERTITPEFVEGFGLSWENDIVFRRPDTVEEAFDLILELGKAGLICASLFDSVGAAQNEKQLSRDVGATDVGGISKLLHETMRQLCKVCEDHTMTAFFINHITMKPGVVYGSPETTPGGRALPYYASTRLKVYPMKENPKNKGSGVARVKPVKHKTGLPYLLKGTIDYDFAYGKGPDPIRDLADTAKALGLVRHSAGQSKMRDSLDTEDWYVPDPNIPKLQAGYVDWLIGNPEAQEKLRGLVLKQDLSTLSTEDGE